MLFLIDKLDHSHALRLVRVVLAAEGVLTHLFNGNEEKGEGEMRTSLQNRDETSKENEM